MSSEVSHIAVFGPGLMGASLLMALREKHPDAKLSAWARREEAVRELVRRGLADNASTNAAEVVLGAKIVVLCVPVDRMVEIAASIAPHVGADTLVTDVGSTKETVVSRLEKIFGPHGNFVGSHPMCGSEESGLDAARADLYEGALCVVCRTPSTRQELFDRADSFWRSIGARTATLTPSDHDAAAATASHVPHIVAAALVELTAGQPAEFRKLCATGFRDTTRIAAGSPALWTTILSENAKKTAAALQQLEAILEGYREDLTRGDLGQIEQRLSAAAKHRANFFPESRA